MSAQTFDDIVFGMLIALVILTIRYAIWRIQDYRTEIKIKKYLDSLDLENKTPKNDTK